MKANSKRLKQIFVVLAAAIFLMFVGIVPGEQRFKAPGGGKIPKVEMLLDIAEVWSGHPVGFCLLTHGNHQYVGYYDRDRQMTVAMRTLDSVTWVYQVLPETVGWDSHNYITMAGDDDGYIHLSGNMHNDDLVYFRTTEPYDISSFKRIPKMIGTQEKSCTYPQFITGKNNELIFCYRDGSSGNGVQIFNAYDVEMKGWRGLLPTALLDGLGKVNAYPEGPVLGPDGLFHTVWVWRDHGGCESNHDLCYARTKDMVNWETATGRKIRLPITPNTRGTVVDPVPAGGGMINDTTMIGFDSKGRVIVSYHKFDEKGYTQIYNARVENGRWKFYQTSDWSYRWYFSGGGCIILEVDIGPVMLAQGGFLAQGYYHKKYGAGIWKLDEKTLKPVETMKGGTSLLGDLAKPESDFPGMQVRWQRDSGENKDSNVQYFLRWETLPINRDAPRETIPRPMMLRLYKVRDADFFDLKMSCIHDGFFS